MKQETEVSSCGTEGTVHFHLWGGKSGISCFISPRFWAVRKATGVSRTGGGCLRLSWLWKQDLSRNGFACSLLDLMSLLFVYLQHDILWSACILTELLPKKLIKTLKNISLRTVPCKPPSFNSGLGRISTKWKLENRWKFITRKNWFVFKLLRVPRSASQARKTFFPVSLFYPHPSAWDSSFRFFILKIRAQSLYV